MFLSPLLLCTLFLVRASRALYLLVPRCWPVKRVVLGTLSCWLLLFLLQLWLVRFYSSFPYSTSPFLPTISAFTWTRFGFPEDGGSTFFRNVESLRGAETQQKVGKCHALLAGLQVFIVPYLSRRAVGWSELHIAVPSSVPGPELSSCFCVARPCDIHVCSQLS